MSDLAVLGQDPGFGGGAEAMMSAFLDLARRVGRQPHLTYTPQPSFSDGNSSPLDRVEALRIVRGTRRLMPELRCANQVWVVATLATHGYAAARSGRPYACWLATSLADENRGRLRGLPFSRRAAAHVNAPALSRLERAVLHGASRIYGISAASRESILRAGGLSEDRVAVLPIPIDVDLFTPEADEKWLARLEQPVLAFVGRGDDPRKNVALALAALPIIRARIPGTTLQLIGRPPSLRLPAGAIALGEAPSSPDCSASRRSCSSRRARRDSGSSRRRLSPLAFRSSPPAPADPSYCCTTPAVASSSVAGSPRSSPQPSSSSSKTAGGCLTSDAVVASSWSANTQRRSSPSAFDERSTAEVIPSPSRAGDNAVVSPTAHGMSIVLERGPAATNSLLRRLRLTANAASRPRHVPCRPQWAKRSCTTFCGLTD